jgi:predicted DNA-binding protein (UPF0251 family)
MSRPPKCRRVAFLPEATYFKPVGVPLRVLDEAHLSVEEAEAIRLKDLEGLGQEESAEKMNISRPTFQRVLASARQKIADALFNSKAIRIGGGNFEIAPRRFRCLNGHEWDVPFEVVVSVPPKACPTCNTLSIKLLQPLGSGRGRGWGGHGYGRFDDAANRPSTPTPVRRQDGKRMRAR